MKVRRVGPGIHPEETDEGLLVAPDRATAARLRSRRPGLRVIVAADRLPFRDGALEALVDERADRQEVVAEGARVVRGGGKVILLADVRGGGGLLGALWKRTRPALSATDASAWLLGAGCDELTQSAPREGLVVTEGRVRGPR